MAKVQARIETALERFLPPAGIAPRRLHDAMRYAALGGGKRIRPLLVFAAGEAAADVPARADPLKLEIAACAVEYIHTYSLVHDDLPCMDDDVLRRGKPACHVEFDVATALLAGDSLQSLAFQLLAEHRLSDDPAVRVEMVKILALACGSRGMAGGQAIDLASVGRTLTLPELEHMHIHKTGALIRASVALGARCSNALAFQVVDDVLDQEPSTATLGKTAGKDAANNKPTYVSVLGLARAKALAEELREEAQAALSELGAGARRLSELADFIVLRKF